MSRQRIAIIWALALAAVAVGFSLIVSGQRTLEGERDWLPGFVAGGPFIVGAAIFGAVSLLLADVE